MRLFLFYRYDAHLLLSCLHKPDPELASHSALLVYNVKSEGDTWLIDLSTFCTLEPLNMDFEKESPVYTECYAPYKYVKKDDLYIRLQRPSEALPIPHVEDGWAHAYYFKLEPCSRDDLAAQMDKILYKNTAPSNWFHFLPLISIFPEKKAVIFRKEYFLREGNDGKIHKENIDGDIVQVIKEEFPAMPLEEIAVAIARSKFILAQRMKMTQVGSGQVDSSQVKSGQVESRQVGSG